MVRLLFVDDDERAHTTLAMVLPREYRLVSVTSLAAARPLLEAGGIDAVLLDIHLPDGSGLDLLRQIQAVSPPPTTVMLSASDDVPTVVEAMRRGAADYLVKPYQLDALLATLATTIANSAARHAAQAEDSDETDALLGRLAGDSAPMSEVRATVGMYATADAPVLVTGESGTGKELVAHLIHQCSHRREGPFIAVNAAALPESLVESELFGSVEGAFTGAITRPGCFEQADGGTLFLDEVGEMALAAQAKLLRVIESKEVTRVGARAATQVSVRMVSATNRQPAAAVAARDGFGRTCTTASGYCQCSSRRCAIGATTSPRSPTRYWKTCIPTRRDRSGFTPTRLPDCRNTRGPATCACCATCWSAPGSVSSRATPSARERPAQR